MPCGGSDARSRVEYSAGHLFFEQDGGLYAQAFDIFPLRSVRRTHAHIERIGYGSGFGSVVPIRSNQISCVGGCHVPCANVVRAVHFDGVACQLPVCGRAARYWHLLPEGEHHRCSRSGAWPSVTPANRHSSRDPGTGRRRDFFADCTDLSRQAGCLCAQASRSTDGRVYWRRRE